MLNASRSDRVMVGMFGGTRSDPDGPNGLVASTAAPAVYANDYDDILEDLVDDGTRFAPLNSTLLRDWTVRSVKLTGDSHVKALWLDEDGAHVTYVVEGEEQMVLSRGTTSRIGAASKGIRMAPDFRGGPTPNPSVVTIPRATAISTSTPLSHGAQTRARVTSSRTVPEPMPPACRPEVRPMPGA